MELANFVFLWADPPHDHGTSNDQEKCFDTFLHGVHLLVLRLLHHPGPLPPDPPPSNTVTWPHAGYNHHPPTTRAVALHESINRRQGMRCRLPGIALPGPVIGNSRGIAQGTSGGCDTVNAVVEFTIRIARRAFQASTGYSWSSRDDGHHDPAFDPSVLQQYSDDNHGFAGDTPEATAPENAMLIAGGVVPLTNGTFGQHMDPAKSWALHQIAGIPQPHRYEDAWGCRFADLSEKAVFKTLGFFFATDTRNDAAVWTAIMTAVRARVTHVASTDAPAAIRVAAIRDLGYAMVRHHARGTWTPTVDQAQEAQDFMLSTLLYDVLLVHPDGPTELPANTHVPVIPEHLARPVTAGGIGYSLMVTRPTPPDTASVSARAMLSQPSSLTCIKQRGAVRASLRRPAN